MRCMPTKPLSGQTCCVMVTGERRRRRSLPQAAVACREVCGPGSASVCGMPA